MPTLRIAALTACMAIIGSLLAPLPAGAETTTLCTQEAGYEVCGRAFPDPQAGLGLDPNQEGAIPATDFIQYGMPGQAGMSQIWDGLTLLERRYDRWLEVWQLDDLLDEPDALSAGLWFGDERRRLPLIFARVTDESVPAADKRRFVFGLSLHGIERAGVEGGTRALEDLVTYAYCESLGGLTAARADEICAMQNHVAKGAYVEGEGGFPARLLPWDRESMTMGEVLKHVELYFTYNNPDGWHRGDRAAFGGLSHYQRYNGNGVDPNRDWPTEGYTFAPFTPASEPETKYFAEALRARGGNWASGLDLHGQGCAPVLTYTMLPAGQHDFRKNARIRAIAERTQRDATERLSWSLFIDDGSGRPSLPPPGTPPFCGLRAGGMGGQQWGTVWDTIDYTVTGSYGDWINSPAVGLGGIGLSNEMSMSHVTNCIVGSCFFPDIEQLHVAGNKGLIYADIDTTLRTEDQRMRFPMKARGAYLIHDKVAQSAGAARALNALDLPPQEALSGVAVCTIAGGDLIRRYTDCTSEEFEVLGPSDGHFNGGITVNVAHLSTHTINDIAGSFTLQRFDVEHGNEGEWIDVATNQTGGQAYLNNGQTIAANSPEPGRYRVLLRPGTPGPYVYDVTFSAERAYADPGQRPYEVSNLDLFAELEPYLPKERRFRGLTVAEVVNDPQTLDRFDVFVLADEALPGWNFAKPGKSDAPVRTHAAFMAALRRWVRGGGTLVLTDAALQALPDLLKVARLKPERSLVFAGFVGFNDGSGTTYDDPLAAKVNVPGAAEGSGNRHQTYEPVPLGFGIEAGFGGPDRSPVWTVDQQAFERAGGRVAGRIDGRVVLGEIGLGTGSIRIAGALLPTPTEEYDHPFGLASYALTWTGWQLFENLVAAEARARPPEVLGRTHELPRTGLTAGWIVFLLGLAGAALLMRRLRDSSLI